MTKSTKHKRDDTVSLVSKVKTPLGFFVVAITIVETLVLTLTNKSAPFAGFIIYSAIGLIILLIVVVVILAWFKPGTLMGTTVSLEGLPNSIADDMYAVMDGFLQNLESAEQVEAWLEVASLFKSTEQDDPSKQRFYLEISKRIEYRANLKNKRLPKQGPIK